MNVTGLHFVPFVPTYRRRARIDPTVKVGRSNKASLNECALAMLGDPERIAIDIARRSTGAYLRIRVPREGERGLKIRRWGRCGYFSFHAIKSALGITGPQKWSAEDGSLTVVITDDDQLTLVFGPVTPPADGDPAATEEETDHEVG